MIIVLYVDDLSYRKLQAEIASLKSYTKPSPWQIGGS